MYVMPVAGRKVPDPYRLDILPAEGRTVEDNQYWQRRIDDGDVVKTSPQPEAAVRGKAKE